MSMFLYRQVIFSIYVFCIKYFSSDLGILTTLSLNSQIFQLWKTTNYHVHRIQLEIGSKAGNQGPALHPPGSL